MADDPLFCNGYCACRLASPARSVLLLGFFHRALGGVDGFTSSSSSFTGLVGGFTSSSASRTGCGGSSSASSVGGAGSGISSAFSGVHRAVGRAFHGCSGVFGTGSGVISSRFSASGQAERCGEDQRQCDRLFHLGGPLIKFWHKCDGTNRMSEPIVCDGYRLGQHRATPYSRQGANSRRAAAPKPASMAFRRGSLR